MLASIPQIIVENQFYELTNKIKKKEIRLTEQFAYHSLIFLQCFARIVKRKTRCSLGLWSHANQNIIVNARQEGVQREPRIKLVTMRNVSLIIIPSFQSLLQIWQLHGVWQVIAYKMFHFTIRALIKSWFLLFIDKVASAPLVNKLYFFDLRMDQQPQEDLWRDRAISGSMILFGYKSASCWLRMSAVWALSTFLVDSIWCFEYPKDLSEYWAN